MIFLTQYKLDTRETVFCRLDKYKTKNVGPSQCFAFSHFPVGYK